MWAPGVASSSPLTPPPETTQTADQVTQDPTATPLASSFAGVSREELVIQLQHANAQIDTYECRLRLQAAQRQGTQESESNQTDEDESLDNGRPAPAVQMVRPDARIFLPDTLGMRVGVAPDTGQEGRQVGGQGRRDHAQLVTSLTGHPGPRMEWSEGGVVSTPAVTAEETCPVLVRALQQCQEALEEVRGEKRRAEQLNQCLLSQLTAAHLDSQVSKQEAAVLREQLTTKDSEIRDLKRQLQNERSRPLTLRPGVKRGRFLMSPPLECANCHGVFSSEQDAHSSSCRYHPKAACKLPNKMVVKMFGTEPSKHRYWPCCKQIGTQLPPPCHCGTHLLRDL